MKSLFEMTRGIAVSGAFAAGVAAFGAQGCSGSTSTTSGGDASAEDQAACTAEAQAICTLRSGCSMTYLIDRTYADSSACETRTALSCVASLSAPGTAQSVSRVQACTSAYPSEACTDYLDGNPTSACVPPAGTGQTGAPCAFSGQCASTFCAVSQYQVCGTCQPLPQAGAACQVAADCGRNLGCAVPTNATTGTCSTYAAQGGACLTGKQLCAAGLACVGDDPTNSTMGTCQTTGTSVGAACDATRKTAATCNTDMGLVCIPTKKGSAVGTCQKIQLVGSGAMCGDIGAAPITGYADCAAGGVCIKQLTDAGTAANTGVCSPPAADGAACDSDTTKGPPCLTPAKCVPTSDGGTAGTCTLPNPATCK
jgi:hypothetical protein